MLARVPKAGKSKEKMGGQATCSNASKWAWQWTGFAWLRMGRTVRKAVRFSGTLNTNQLTNRYSRQLSQCSVWLLIGRPGFDPRQRQRILPVTSASRPALGPTQPPIQWIPGALSPGVKRGRGVILTTHPLLVPRLRKSRSYTSCHPNAPLWSVTEPLHLFLINL
jgi:hypothetical protein